MKRRTFLTTAALGSAAAIVAPKVFSQDPNAWYNEWAEDFHSWEVVPRGIEHVEDNNYWHALQGVSEWGHGDVLQQWTTNHSKYFEYAYVTHPKCTLYSIDKPPEPTYPNDGSGGQRTGRIMHPWDNGGVINMHYGVLFKDFYNVMVGQDYWMNVDDYVFYQRLLGMGEHCFINGHLMGAGLVPMWQDPFMRNKLLWTPHCAEGNPSYEIHVIWRKR